MARQARTLEIEKTHAAEHLRDALDDLEYAVKNLVLLSHALLQRGAEIGDEIGQALQGAEIDAAENAVLTKRLTVIMKSLPKTKKGTRP